MDARTCYKGGEVAAYKISSLLAEVEKDLDDHEYDIKPVLSPVTDYLYAAPENQSHIVNLQHSQLVNCHMNEYLPKALVIGSGFGGIGAALRLRALGYHVDLVERLDSLGGRAQVFEKMVSVMMQAQLLSLRPLCLKTCFHFLMKSSLTIWNLYLSPWYRFHFPDGSDFDYGDDMAAFEAGMAKYREADIEGYAGYLMLPVKFLRSGLKSLQINRF